MEWSGVGGGSQSAPFGDSDEADIFGSRNNTNNPISPNNPNNQVLAMTVRKGMPVEVTNMREPLPTGAWALAMPNTSAEMKPRNQLAVADRFMEARAPVVPAAAQTTTTMQLRDRRSQQPHFGAIQGVMSEMPTSQNAIVPVVPTMQVRDRRSQQPHYGATQGPMSEMPASQNAIVPVVPTMQLRDRRSQQPHFGAIQGAMSEMPASQNAIVPIVEGFAVTGGDGMSAYSTDTVREAITEFNTNTHVKARRFMLPTDFDTIVSGTRTLREAVYLCEAYPSADPPNAATEKTFLEAALITYVTCLYIRINTCYTQWRRAGWKDANETAFGRPTWFGILTTSANTVIRDRDNLVKDADAWFPKMAASFQTHLAARMGDLGSLMTLAYGTVASGNMGLTGKPVIVTTVRRGAGGGAGYILLSRGGQTITATNVGIRHKTADTYTNVAMLAGALQDQGQPTVAVFTSTPARYTVQAYVTYGTPSVTEYGTEEVYDTRRPSVTASISLGSYGGTVTLEGGAPVTDVGILWTSSPTVTNETLTGWNGAAVPANCTKVSSTVAIKLGAFNVPEPAFTNPNSYRIVAYATNGFGTTVTSSVVTIAPQLPTFGTSTVTLGADGISFTASGSISNANGTVTARGFEYAVGAGTYTRVQDTTSSGANISVMISPNPPLVANTSYNIRPYVTTQYGTGTGIVVTQSTAAPPSVTTSPLTVSGTTITAAGTISATGGAPVSERGFVYSRTNTTPTLNADGTVPSAATFKFTDTPPTGTAISGSFSGLAAGTTYYVRAFARNIAGYGYGGTLNTTTQNPPSFGTFSSNTTDFALSIRIIGTHYAIVSYDTHKLRLFDLRDMTFKHELSISGSINFPISITTYENIAIIGQWTGDSGRVLFVRLNTATVQLETYSNWLLPLTTSYRSIYTLQLIPNTTTPADSILVIFASTSPGRIITYRCNYNHTATDSSPFGSSIANWREGDDGTTTISYFDNSTVDRNNGVVFVAQTGASASAKRPSGVVRATFTTSAITITHAYESPVGHSGIDTDFAYDFYFRGVAVSNHPITDSNYRVYAAQKRADTGDIGGIRKYKVGNPIATSNLFIEERTNTYNGFTNFQGGIITSNNNYLIYACDANPVKLIMIKTSDLARHGDGITLSNTIGCIAVCRYGTDSVIIATGVNSRVQKIAISSGDSYAAGDSITAGDWIQRVIRLFIDVTIPASITTITERGVIIGPSDSIIIGGSDVDKYTSTTVLPAGSTTRMEVSVTAPKRGWIRAYVTYTQGGSSLTQYSTAQSYGSGTSNIPNIFT